jgi:hypothetical protein
VVQSTVPFGSPAYLKVIQASKKYRRCKVVPVLNYAPCHEDVLGVEVQLYSHFIFEGLSILCRCL